MKVSLLRATAVVALLLLGVAAHAAPAKGWLTWRGPQQNGTSLETGLPDKWAVGGVNQRWQIDLAGSGTPVIANGKLYAIGYQGEREDLQEVLVCLDAETGRKLWEQRYSDFLSDVAYDRYGIGSPTVDAETGNVYVLTTPGIFACYTGDGKLLWKYSMMEQFGRLTFPNNRTGGPVIEDDLVIVRGITSNWGADGPAMDRFYAFDKKSGALVWTSSPGGPPKDNSFALPAFAWWEGKRVIYSGDGSGNVVCINARTGEALWRYPMSAGGINASVLLYKDTVIAIHNDENLDTSDIGRQVAVKIGPVTRKPGDPPGPVVRDKSAEAWRNELRSLSSSPVLVGDRIYQVTFTGSIACVDANTGKILFQHKLAPDQLHASLLYADGKLYVPMHNGTFYILKPGEKEFTELAKVKLDGFCNGAPAAWNGKIYVFSTKKLYCFGKKGNNPKPVPTVAAEPRPKAGPTAALQIIPSEVLVRPGERVKFVVRGIDANGFPTTTFNSSQAKWVKYIPPTARVRAEMSAEFDAQGELVVPANAPPSAGAFEATIDGFKGYIRGRVLPGLPLNEDFEKFDLNTDHATETGVKFAYPPLPWIGARFKWEIRDLDGNKVLTKTLDNIFFQRAMSFIAAPDLQNYTVEADVMTDGNRRTSSIVGLINQRYLIMLNGNSQELEVNSNLERLRVAVPFAWSAKTWYRLKTRVDVAPDGSGVIRAKAWKKGDPEPASWTIEVPHKHAHTSGSPGVFGFALQSMFRVYVDNISVTPNK